MITVYLLHFEPRYQHAQHYIGVTRGDPVRRWMEHLDKKGAVLTRYARRAGCLLILARIWPDCEFAFEAKLKRRGSAARLCPICKRKAGVKKK